MGAVHIADVHGAVRGRLRPGVRLVIRRSIYRDSGPSRTAVRGLSQENVRVRGFYRGVAVVRRKDVYRSSGGSAGISGGVGLDAIAEGAAGQCGAPVAVQRVVDVEQGGDLNWFAPCLPAIGGRDYERLVFRRCVEVLEADIHPTGGGGPRAPNPAQGAILCGVRKSAP